MVVRRMNYIMDNELELARNCGGLACRLPQLQDISGQVITAAAKTTSYCCGYYITYELPYLTLNFALSCANKMAHRSLLLSFLLCCVGCFGHDMTIILLLFTGFLSAA